MMKRGFTLVEVLISLFIFGVLFAVGSLSFRDFGRRQIVIAAGRETKANLRLAETESLAGKKPAGCNGTLVSYRIRRVSNIQYVIEASCTGNGSAVLVRSVNMSNNITMDAFTPNPPNSYIEFKSVGVGTNLVNNVNITLRASSGTTYTQTITISVAGDIR